MQGAREWCGRLRGIAISKMSREGGVDGPPFGDEAPRIAVNVASCGAAAADAVTISSDLKARGAVGQPARGFIGPGGGAGSRGGRGGGGLGLGG